MSNHWSNRGHLLGLEDLSRDELLQVLDEAAAVLPIAEGDAPAKTVLSGRTLATLFFENSTRTRLSFALAARRLGAEVIDLNASTSSTTKGESLLDTALTVQAMGVDALVMRCSASGGPHLVAAETDVPVINAGDGQHEHPTQGLLDALALQRRLGRKTFDGLSIAIVGDIASSRVARSNAHSLTALGADVILTGPPTLVPEAMGKLISANGSTRGTLRLEHDLDAVLESLDAIMMLRVQFERHGGAGVDEDYTSRYGLTLERANRLREGVPVLHPGPVNRGVEIDHEVADGSRSLILEQVTCGVAVRMAVLEGLLS